MYTIVLVNLDFSLELPPGKSTKQKPAKSALPDFMQVGWSRMGIGLPVALPLRSGGKKKKRSRHVGIGLFHLNLLIFFSPFSL